MENIKQVLLIHLMLLFAAVNAQSILDRSLSTGFDFSNSFYPLVDAELELLNDSILYIEFNLADSNGQRVESRLNFYYDLNLNMIDSNVVWNRQGHKPNTFYRESNISANYTIDNATGTWYRYTYELLSDTTGEFKLYTTNAKKQASRLLFSKINNQHWSAIPYVYDTTLVLFSLASNRVSDLIENYSLNSFSLLKSDSSFMSLRSIPLRNYDKVLTHPFNPNKLIFTSSTSSFDNVVILDWVNQSIDQVLNDGTTQRLQTSLVVNHKIHHNDFADFNFDSTSMTFVGTTEKFDILNPSLLFTRQIAKLKVGYNDTLISVQEFGSIALGDDESASCYLRNDSVEYILGTNIGDKRVYLPPNRQLILYRITSVRKDSLIFYGQNNHSPLKMVQTKNGDLFILSNYSDHSSTREVFLNLTKISSSLITTIQEQKLSRKLYLYPNPTQGYLKSDEFEKAERILIYDVKGRLLEERAGGQEALDLQNLERGTYLIQSIQEGKASSGIFVKQ